MTGRILPRSSTRLTEPVLRRLGSLATLSEAEIEVVRRLDERRDRHRVGDELFVEGDAARRPRFVISGWASAQRVLADGRRQIFGFSLPGDGLGLYPRMTPPALYTVVATTAMETVDAQPVLDLVRGGASPGLLRAFAAAARAEDAMLLDHIIRLGRQTAYERVAHFLLETQERLAIVGLGDNLHFPLPLTQEVLADALGLSIVHVNRTLQQLRRDKLIEWRSGVAVLLQKDLLTGIADYKSLNRPASGGGGNRELASLAYRQ
jgi:CRP-like cAMP-binding protein